MKENKQADIVISNPPFGRYYRHDGNDKQHQRLGDIALEHFESIIDSLKPGGQAAILLPDGVFYRSTRSREVLRKANNVCNLTLVIQLPQTEFKDTNLTKVSLFFLSKKTKSELLMAEQDKIPIYDASGEVNEYELDELVRGVFSTLKELCGKRAYAEVKNFLGNRADRFKICTVDSVINGEGLRYSVKNLKHESDNVENIVDKVGVCKMAIPDGWDFSKLGNIVSRITPGKSYKHVKQKPTNSEVGLLKTSAISKGVFDVAECKYIIESSKIKPEHYVRTGDLLVCRANSPEYVGASVLVVEEIQRRVLSDKIWKLHIDDKLKLWVCLYLKTKYGRELMRTIANGAFSSMRNMRQKDFLELTIPLPNSKEDCENLTNACKSILEKNIERTNINTLLSEVSAEFAKFEIVG